MQTPNIQGTAISIESDDNGKEFYRGHIFLDDHRVIALDPCPTPEIAQEQIDKFIQAIPKLWL